MPYLGPDLNEAGLTPFTNDGRSVLLLRLFFGFYGGVHVFAVDDEALEEELSDAVEEDV